MPLETFLLRRQVAFQGVSLLLVFILVLLQLQLQAPLACKFQGHPLSNFVVLRSVGETHELHLLEPVIRERVAVHNAFAELCAKQYTVLEHDVPERTAIEVDIHEYTVYELNPCELTVLEGGMSAQASIAQTHREAMVGNVGETDVCAIGNDGKLQSGHIDVQWHRSRHRRAVLLACHPLRLSHVQGQLALRIDGAVINVHFANVSPCFESAVAVPGVVEHALDSSHIPEDHVLEVADLLELAASERGRADDAVVKRDWSMELTVSEKGAEIQTVWTVDDDDVVRWSKRIELDVGVRWYR